PGIDHPHPALILRVVGIHDPAPLQDLLLEPCRLLPPPSLRQEVPEPLRRHEVPPLASADPLEDGEGLLHSPHPLVVLRESHEGREIARVFRHGIASLPPPPG